VLAGFAEFFRCDPSAEDGQPVTHLVSGISTRGSGRSNQIRGSPGVEEVIRGLVGSASERRVKLTGFDIPPTVFDFGVCLSKCGIVIAGSPTTAVTGFVFQPFGLDEVGIASPCEINGSADVQSASAVNGFASRNIDLVDLRSGEPDVLQECCVAATRLKRSSIIVGCPIYAFLSVCVGVEAGIEVSIEEPFSCFCAAVGFIAGVTSVVVSAGADFVAG